jgi:hypothetical protein
MPNMENPAGGNGGGSERSVRAAKPNNPEDKVFIPTAQAPADLTGSVLIEHATTSDLDGLPWPPTGFVDGWVLVCAIGEGKTLWRRITINITEEV